MTKEDKQNLQNKKLTDSIIISCLATCESVISRNAYLEKKWSNCSTSYIECYSYKKQEWMKYREKLRMLLLPVYSMKLIIQMAKGCTNKASQKTVKEVIELIDKNDYMLL